MVAPTTYHLLENSLPEELLCRALRVSCGAYGCESEWLSTLSPTEMQGLFSAALRHGFGALLYWRLNEAGMLEQFPLEASQELRKVFLRLSGECLHRQRQLARLVETLQCAGVPTLLLKGAYLAETVYPNAALRPMSDLDIMVPKANLTEAARALEALDYRAGREFSVDDETRASHQLPVFLAPRRYPVEIHWTLVLPELPYCINPRELWERAQKITVSGRETLGLSPEDLLLHLCLHAATQHHLTSELRLVYDIALVLDYYQESLDWDSLIKRATEWKAEYPLGLMMLLSQQLFGTRLPEQVWKFIKTNPISPDVQRVAVELLFTKRKTGAGFSRPLATMLDSQGFKEKIRLLWRQIFLPPQLMATVYPAPPGSARLWLYYPRRFSSLFRRHSSSIWKALRKDPAALSAADRSREIQQKEDYLLEQILHFRKADSP